MDANSLHKLLDYFPLVVKRPDLALFALNVDILRGPLGAPRAGAASAMPRHAVFSASSLAAVSASDWPLALSSAIILA